MYFLKMAIKIFMVSFVLLEHCQSSTHGLSLFPCPMHWVDSQLFQTMRLQHTASLWHDVFLCVFSHSYFSDTHTWNPDIRSWRNPYWIMLTDNLEKFMSKRTEAPIWCSPSFSSHVREWVFYPLPFESLESFVWVPRHFETESSHLHWAQIKW